MFVVTNLQDKEGVLYQTEIEQLLKDLNGEAFLKLSKALEMNPESINDKFVSLCQWSCEMGSLARSHLLNLGGELESLTWQKG